VNTVFQKYALFPHLNVFNNVAFGLKLKKEDPATIKKKVRQALKMANLTGYEERKVDTLSGGQQQRVAFLRLLCQPADFLLLDEPVSHLDIENAKIMADMLCEYQAKSNVGIIVTSIGHRMPYSYDQLLKL
jgi:spermidine/putrescine transport system ATP-binding protein